MLLVKELYTRHSHLLRCQAVSFGRHHVSSNREHALSLAARRQHSKHDPDKVGEQLELLLVSLPPAQLLNICRSILKSLVAVALLPELGNHWR